MIYISTNITYEKVIHSNTATAKGIDNIPDAEQLLNIKALAKYILEPIIEKFGMFQIDSFFRCKELNKVVGGVFNSQHTTGQAIDIKAKAPATNAAIFNHIKNNLPSDQLIWEKGDNNNPEWIHISFSRMKNRKQILYMI